MGLEIELVSSAPSRAGVESTPICECCVCLISREVRGREENAHHVEDPGGQERSVCLHDDGVGWERGDVEGGADRADESVREQYVAMQELVTAILASPDGRIADQSRWSFLRSSSACVLEHDQPCQLPSFRRPQYEEPDSPPRTDRSSPSSQSRSAGPADGGAWSTCPRSP